VLRERLKPRQFRRGFVVSGRVGFGLFVLVGDADACSDGIFGTLCRNKRFGFEFLLHLLDGGVELRVVAVLHLRRIVYDHNIRVYAMPLNAPVPIEERRIARNADQPAPCARADLLDSGLTIV